MPRLQTLHFGVVEYDPDSVIRFPAGLPAFEDHKEFLVIEPPVTAPLVFLQSLLRAELSFLAVAVSLLDASYRLRLNATDAALLGLTDENRETADGPDIRCLILLTPASGGQPATANLLAPVVIHRAARLGVQCIQIDSGYAPDHVIGGPTGTEAAPCS